MTCRNFPPPWPLSPARNNGDGLLRKTILLLGLLLSTAPATTRADNVPVPQPRPEHSTPAPPVPEEKPAVPAADAEKTVPAEKPTETPPVPVPPTPSAPPPTPATPPPPEPTPAPAPALAPAPPPPTPVEKEDPAAFEACTEELSTLGVEFKPLARINDGEGCGIDRPLGVTSLSSKVKLEPEATLRCDTALQLARMTRDMLEPAARLALPDKGPLTSVHHASAYVCRNRNGAEDGKISEHARGNAIDISSLEFEKGTVPMSIAKPEDSDLAAAFQRSLNAFACLYFRTVLSPGSDAAHQDHLHLDILERNGDFRYCR
nr:extensin family protein [Rhizobium sp. ACO-34A]